MRDLVFEFGTELVGIQINNKRIQFCKLQGGYYSYSPIEGLKLSVSGILKEFPDLKDKTKEVMRRIAMKRFKKHIEGLKKESDIQEYLKKDLAKHGYKLKYVKRPGFRRKRVKWLGFFDSKMFQDILALGILGYFGLAFYSMFRKQTVKDTFAQIKEWYNNLDMEGEDE